jgi:hypothetical protein
VLAAFAVRAVFAAFFAVLPAAVLPFAGAAFSASAIA